MHQFFVERGQINGTEIIIRGQDVRHIRDVLRMKSGAEIAVSNGTDGREYRCILEEFGEEEIRCKLIFIKADGAELSSRVYLFQSLPKADKMELVIQKAVELGVFQIVPVAAQRAVVKLDEKKSKTRVSRWQGIAEAAAKQSKRGVIPQVRDVMNFREAVAYAAGMDVKLIPYELAEGMERTRELIGGIQPGQEIAVFIGPEGGFAGEEIKAAREAGIEPITLGRRILRTETAGLTVLGWIMYQLES